MDYLQYDKEISYVGVLDEVLNLVINGLPSIQKDFSSNEPQLD